MVKLPEHLTEEHYKEIIAIQAGADVFGYRNAKLLREVEALEPSFIHICDAKGEYDPVGQLPYFGAIATETGITFAKRRLTKIARIKGE